MTAQAEEHILKCLNEDHMSSLQQLSQRLDVICFVGGWNLGWSRSSTISWSKTDGLCVDATQTSKVN